jgi:hypothetical protein
VVKAPQQRAAKNVDDPVSTLIVHDIIVDTVNGRSHADRSGPIFAEAFPMGAGVPVTAIRPARAVVDGHYKLLENLDGTRELYDLLNDPAETINLADRPTVLPLFTKLTERLASWQPGNAQPLAAAPHLSVDVQRRLRSLGYVTHSGKGTTP